MHTVCSIWSESCDLYKSIYLKYSMFTCWYEVVLLWGVVRDKSFWFGPKMVGSEEVRYRVPEIMLSQFHHILALIFTCKVFKILGHEILDTLVKVDWSVDSPSDWSGTLNCLFARASIFRFCLSSLYALYFMHLTADNFHSWKHPVRGIISVKPLKSKNRDKIHLLEIWKSFW